MDKTALAARQILSIIPLIMRPLESELRHLNKVPNPVHFHLLHLLAERPYHLSELAERTAVSRPTMSKSIHTLSERGWATRTESEHDRRHVVVEVTDAGRSVLLELFQTAEARIAARLAGLSPAEIEQLLAGLSVLQSAFEGRTAP